MIPVTLTMANFDWNLLSGACVPYTLNRISMSFQFNCIQYFVLCIVTQLLQVFHVQMALVSFRYKSFIYIFPRKDELEEIQRLLALILT